MTLASSPTVHAAPSLEQQIKSGRLVRGMSFSQKVWALTARVPRGRVTTYGEIARALGTRASRAVGNALNKNPYAPTVPCHRVVGSAGRLTGFAARAGGVDQKRRLLSDEGVRVARDRVVVTDFYLFEDLPRGGDAGD